MMPTRLKSSSPLTGDKSFISKDPKVGFKTVAVDNKLSQPGNEADIRAGVGFGKKGKRNRLSLLGIDMSRLVEKGSPEWVNMLQLANSYRKLRQKEIYIQHGYVSAGVGAFIGSAALAMGASRLIYSKCSESGDLSLLRLASQLADSARQNELAAWELAAREGKAYRAAKAQEQGVPWLRTADGLEERRGPKHKHTPVLTSNHSFPYVGEAVGETSPPSQALSEVSSEDAGNSGQT